MRTNIRGENQLKSTVADQLTLDQAIDSQSYPRMTKATEMRMIARHSFDGYHIGYKVLPGLMMEDGPSNDEVEVYVTHESGVKSHRNRAELEPGQKPEPVALLLAGDIIKRLKQHPEK